jgi:hypothetical protein
MKTDSSARSHYLALALDTRMVIDSLVAFIDKGTRKVGFEKELQEVLDSIESAFGAPGVTSHLRRPLAENYEQVQTWDEVLSPSDREKIISKLHALKSENVALDAQKRDAFDVLELLAKVENRALYNYRPQSA